MLHRSSAVLGAEIRRHRAPDDLTQLPELPAWLRTSGAPSGPALPPKHVITPSMREVLRLVTRLAAMSAEMPNNPTLGALVGGRGRSCVLRALRRLQAATLLVVEHQGSRRRVTIMGTGRSTAWGEARPGHSPYLHRRRGEPAVPLAKAPRRPNTRPLSPQIPAAVQCAPPLVHVAATNCQWPMWKDGERPGPNPLFCGAPCDDTTSFCAMHAGDVYRKRVTSAQPRGAGLGKTPAVLRDPRYRNAIVAITELD